MVGLKEAFVDGRVPGRSRVTPEVAQDALVAALAAKLAEEAV